MSLDHFLFQKSRIIFIALCIYITIGTVILLKQFELHSIFNILFNDSLYSANL